VRIAAGTCVEHVTLRTNNAPRVGVPGDHSRLEQHNPAMHFTSIGGGKGCSASFNAGADGLRGLQIAGEWLSSPASDRTNVNADNADASQNGTDTRDAVRRKRKTIGTDANP
jgi:hypothetical protein